ncbi:MAG: hypothetical protein OEX11_09905 [Nitrosomonas sp.]|nr:hypothetical protein [Nitrosomonas sp.]
MPDEQDTRLQKPLFTNLKKTRSTFNSIIIVVAIIMLWRGVWGLLDIYLFPEMPTLSFVVSISIGLVVLYLNDFQLDNLKK